MLLRPNLGLKYAEPTLTKGALDVAFQEQPPRAVVFVVERDRSSADTIMDLSQTARIRCNVFESCGTLTDAIARGGSPDLIFLDVTTDGADAVEVLHALSQARYRGILQPMSERGVLMVGPIRQLAQLHGLQALEPLTKPLDQLSVETLFGTLTPAVSQTKNAPISIDDAIKNNWLQFWYQPKINFRNKTLVGMETFVRLFHPHKGLLSPASVLKNADERSLTALAQHGLVDTATAGARLLELGLNPTIAINVTLKALTTLPVARIVRDYIGRTGRQPSWIFDVDEEDLARNRAMIKDIDAMLRSVGVKLAVDNFKGKSIPSTSLRELPIAELKISSALVARCDSKPEDAAACKKVIDLAHDMLSIAVAVGVETSQQSQALQRMGCDIGQGFLFGQPLPLEQIIAMVRQRSVPAPVKVAGRTM